jgi:hypothetical protein
MLKKIFNSKFCHHLILDDSDEIKLNVAFKKLKSNKKCKKEPLTPQLPDETFQHYQEHRNINFY